VIEIATKKHKAHKGLVNLLCGVQFSRQTRQADALTAANTLYGSEGRIAKDIQVAIQGLLLLGQ
jgi:hypothetical protein